MEGLKSEANLAGQRIMTKRSTKATHVILCIAPGLYIHSNKGKGVAFDLAENVQFSKRLEKGKYYLCRVVRPRIPNDEEQRHNFQNLLVEKDLYFYEQKYNLLLSAKRSNDKSSAFCSEFISQVYREAGRPLSNVQDSKVYPATLEACLTSPDWIDVTEEYRRGLTCINNKSNCWLDDLSRKTVLLKCSFIKHFLLTEKLAESIKDSVRRGDPDCVERSKAI